MEKTYRTVNLLIISLLYCTWNYYLVCVTDFVIVILQDVLAGTQQYVPSEGNYLLLAWGLLIYCCCYGPSQTSLLRAIIEI